MRYMGLDFGTKTVGVAISDETGLIAQPLCTVTRQRVTKLRRTYAELERLAAEHEVGLIVVGLPKHLSGSEGERSVATRQFAMTVKRRTGIPIVLWDERLTTVEADRILDATGVAESARKEYIDKMAAAIILQSYMDHQKAKLEAERAAEEAKKAEEEAEASDAGITASDGEAEPSEQEENAEPKTEETPEAQAVTGEAGTKGKAADPANEDEGDFPAAGELAEV